MKDGPTRAAGYPRSYPFLLMQSQANSLLSVIFVSMRQSCGFIHGRAAAVTMAVGAHFRCRNRDCRFEIEVHKAPPNKIRAKLCLVLMVGSSVYVRAKSAMNDEAKSDGDEECAKGRNVVKQHDPH
jgi:hypothetical protein